MVVVLMTLAVIGGALDVVPAAASTGRGSRAAPGRASPAAIPRVPCCGGGGPSYNGRVAAAYADRYVGSTLWGASGWNANYQLVWQRMEADDCTEFVSEALVAGGLRWVDDGGQDGSEGGASFFDYQNDWEWWLMDTVQAYVHDGEYAQSWSDTASVAPMLRHFLLQDGGFQVGIFSFDNGKHSPPAYTPGPMGAGDVLFYDWGTGLGISHAAMQVAAGRAPNGQVGSVIDEHTSNREHAFWSLKDYDPYWRNTTIYFVHV
jgi:hypothetical protein